MSLPVAPADAPAPADGPQRSSLRGAYGAVGFMAFVELISGIHQGFLPPLLPELGSLHGTSAGAVGWVVSMQLLSAAVAVPVLTKLGDMYGHRRLLRIAVAVTLAGAVLIALAPSMPVVLAGRFLMGPLSAWLPLEIAIVHDRIRGEGARRAIGLLIGCMLAGFALGSVLGGWVQGLTGDVRLTLLLPAVLTLACLVVTFRLIPESVVRAARRLDGPGFVGLAAGLLLLQFPLSQVATVGWGATRVWLPLLLAALVLGVWGCWELRTPEPAIDLRALASLRIWPVMLASMMYAIALFGSQSPNSTFLGTESSHGYGFGLSASGIAWATLPQTLTAVVGAQLHTRIARRLGLRGSVALGAVVLALGYGAVVVHDSDLTFFVLAIAVGGFGNGLLSGGLPSLVAENAPEDQTGIAAGLYNTVRTLAGGLAGGVFAVVLGNMVLAGTDIPAATAYHLVWGCCAAAGVVAALLALFVARGGTTVEEKKH